MAILPEFDAHQLKWNRFFNKYGGKGKNISLDLKKEQQNKVLKTFWRALGANINENNGARVAHALEPLEAIVESVYCMVTATTLAKLVQGQTPTKKHVFDK